MTYRYLITMVILNAGIIWNAVFAQIVSVNTPLPWVSLRNDTIVVRAQIDTAALKKKPLTLTLLNVKNGKSSTISTKTFTVKDPSGEFSFGKINRKLIGGEEFLQIKWSVKGSEEKGSIEPVGIADLTPFTRTDTVKCMHVSDDISLKEVATSIGDNFQNTGKAAYCFAWNKKAFFAVFKKAATRDTIKFCFDGKTGKNAFLSYPDRFVATVAADSISIKAIRYKREIRKDSLVYIPEEWRNEITHEVAQDRVVVRIPWYDTGMIPFEERTIGFGIFIVDAKGKCVAALPGSAQMFIPATWGILFLQK